jgi:hypothetical protein
MPNYMRDDVPCSHFPASLRKLVIIFLLLIVVPIGISAARYYLLQALARAHAWLSNLTNDRFASVEELASNADIHPKVMREALKMAFLAPDILTSIFAGEGMFELAHLRKVAALSWQSQRKELNRAN